MGDDRPTFLSLFSGVGGLDLGLERAGWRCVGQVEFDPFCSAVLAHHWPDVPRWGDVREFAALLADAIGERVGLRPADGDGAASTAEGEARQRQRSWDDLGAGGELGSVDLICGGFPCQPVSHAGQRRAQTDERWLWPEFARIVGALRPRLVLVENVPGLVTAGLGDVLGDLAALGYDAQWGVLSAADVGAPHLRERIFVVAVADADGERPAERGLSTVTRDDLPDASGSGGLGTPRSRDGIGAGPVEDAERPRRGCPRGAGAGEAARGRAPARTSGSGGLGIAEPSVCRGADGLPAGMDGRALHRWPTGRGEAQHAWEPPRTARGIVNRSHRLRALGNAVVPAVAEVMGRALMGVVRDTGEEEA